MGSKFKISFLGPQKANPCMKHRFTYWASTSVQRPWE